MTVEMAMDNLYWTFLVLLITFILSVTRIKVRSIDPGTLVPKPKHGIVLIALFLSITLICIFPYYNVGGTGKVVIYERNSEMGFYVPQFPGLNQSFGPEIDFSVGAIRSYLENIGYEVEELNATNPHDLKERTEGSRHIDDDKFKKPNQLN